MIIDIVFFGLILMAIMKGYSKGLIVAIFSFAAIIIGLAAALKLSSSVAIWLQNSTNISTYWLPFLSFLLIMIGVFFLVKLGATFVEKTIQFAMMGWLNKLGGILLFAALYISLFSVILFFFNKMGVIKPETILASKTYNFIEPVAPKVINIFGKIIPIFKNIFEDLTKFFETSLNQSSKF